MMALEILIIAVGVINAGVVALFATVFVKLKDLTKQADVLFDLYSDDQDAYTNIKTTLDFMVREHAELTRQVRALDQVVRPKLHDLDQTSIVYSPRRPR